MARLAVWHGVLPWWALQDFRTAAELGANEVENAQLFIDADHRPVGAHARTYNAPGCTEIAMLRTGSGSIPRGAIAVRSEGELRAVPLFHRSMTPMRFPLLFPLGGDTVETALLVGSGGAIFILAAAGTGKTTVLKTCINNARAKGHIVLATAASAIAAQLLPGGTTFHRALNCPVSINEGDSLAFSVESDNAHARALRQTSMIVVDEGPMLHRFCWEAMDLSLRDLMQVNRPFGGILVVGSGDFRQIGKCV